MSIKLMSSAWEKNLGNHVTKLIALCLCDFANDEGIAYPSWETIMKKCNIGREALSNHLAILKYQNFHKTENHSVFGRGKKVNLYLINQPEEWTEKPIKNIATFAKVFKESIEGINTETITKSSATEPVPKVRLPNPKSSATEHDPLERSAPLTKNGGAYKKQAKKTPRFSIFERECFEAIFSAYGIKADRRQGEWEFKKLRINTDKFHSILHAIDWCNEYEYSWQDPKFKPTLSGWLKSERFIDIQEQSRNIIKDTTKSGFVPRL